MTLKTTIARCRFFVASLAPWQAGAIVAGAAIGLRVILTLHARPTAFGDTREYLEYARQLLRGGIPPLGRRMPGYPLFLIAAGGPAINVHRVMRVQQLLGVCCSLMVFGLLRRVTGRTAVALSGGLVSVFLIDLAGWELEILSDTLARFLVLGAFFCVAVAVTSPRLTRLAILAACLLAGMASIERPVLVLLVVGVLAGLFFIPELRSRASATLLAAAIGFGMIPIAAVITHNLVRDRFAGPVTGAGFSLLDAVGHPQIYRSLPPGLGDIRSIYQNLAAGSPAPGRFVIWSEAIIDLSRTRSAGPAPSTSGDWSDSPAWNAFAQRVALRCIRAVPVGYVRVWSATLGEFFYDFKAVHGFYLTGDDYYGNRPQIWGKRLMIVHVLESFWKVCLPCVSVLSAFLFPLAAFRSRATWKQSGLPLLIFVVMWAIIAVNTAIESGVGQGRYRVPVEELMVVLSFLAH